MEKLFNKDEFRRLEKSLKDKDKNKVFEWGIQFENQLREQLRKDYEKNFQEELSNAVDNFLVAIVYTLHFNEKCKFGNDRIADFMNDMMSTIEMFTKGEYTPDEYREILKKQKIYFDKK